TPFGATAVKLRALLVRIPLGPRPSLHRLRCVSPCRCLRSGLVRFVRRLHSYYGEARLLASSHHPLRVLAFAMRTTVLSTHSTPMARPETSQVPVRPVASGHATLATKRALPFTWTGLPPADRASFAWRTHSITSSAWASSRGGIRSRSR